MTDCGQVWVDASRLLAESCEQIALYRRMWRSSEEIAFSVSNWLFVGVSDVAFALAVLRALSGIVLSSIDYLSL